MDYFIAPSSKSRFLAVLLFAVMLSASCTKEAIEPFDIFEPEKPAAKQVNVLLNGLEGADSIYVNEGRVMETDSGYHIKGTLFSESLSGLIPVTSGDFKIIKDINGNTKSFSGYGTALFAPVGLFTEIEEGFTAGGYFNYHLGSFFKAQENHEKLPLTDERYYFGFDLDDSEFGAKPTIKMKNTTFTFNEYYVDAKDPAFYIKGDFSYKNLKKGKSFAINDVGIGVSANGLFPFKPYEYSGRMEEVTGGTAFEAFKGNLILSGEIPLKKYPITLYGEMVINNQLSDKGPLDFFENGFEDASFELGANGKVIFDHKLLDILPVDLKVELGHATVQAKFSGDKKYIRFAGEYNQEDMLQKIIGSDAMKYIPHSASEGRMYVSIGSKPDDWKLYIETALSLDVPGLGKTDLQEGMLLISPNGIEIFAKMALPYNINEVSFIGKINTDGSFLMKGETTCDLDIHDDLQFYSHLALEVSNTGVFLAGASRLPYGIGDVEINGEITAECLSLGGLINSQIDFGQGLELPAVNIEMKASSCEGVTLAGKLDIPYGIALVAVEGKLTAQEIALSGLFSSHIDFANGVNMPALDMSLSASTLTGVQFKGVLDVPYNIAHVGVEGLLNYQGLRLAGEFNTDIDFGNGFKLPAANMSILASTVPSEGISFAGNMTMPGSIGELSVTGDLNINGIGFTGYMKSKIGIDGFNFSNSFAVSVSSSSGGRINGNINLPGGLADVYVDGWYKPNGSFSLTGSEHHDLDFKVIELGVGFDVTVASNEIDINASGHGCIGVGIAKVCYDPSVSVNPDWGAGKLELCINILGNACIDF